MALNNGVNVPCPHISQKYNAVIRIANIIHKAKGKTTENDEVFLHF